MSELHSSDKALIRAAKTGEGAVEITPDMLHQISENLTDRRADIEARYPKLVAECSDETRLAVAAWVFKVIVDHATEGGTFRTLIYSRLGFGPEAYVPLYLAGGMTISNEFDLSEHEPEKT